MWETESQGGEGPPLGLYTSYSLSEHSTAATVSVPVRARDSPHPHPTQTLLPGQLPCSGKLSAIGPHGGSPSQALVTDMVSAPGLNSIIIWIPNGLTKP